MVKRIITISVIVVLLLIVLPLLLEKSGIYKFFDSLTENITTELYGPARIDQIKQMVKLNTLEAQDEFVFKDTIDDLYVVYDINVKIVVGFNVENMRYKIADDMLYIELPQPSISYYQDGKETLLDIYQTGVGGKIHEWTNLGYEPNLTATQSMKLHGKIARYIEHMVKNRNYEKQAKEMAMHNLANLFFAMRGNVTVTDNLDAIESGPNELEYKKDK